MVKRFLKIILIVFSIKDKFFKAIEPINDDDILIKNLINKFLECLFHYKEENVLFNVRKQITYEYKENGDGIYYFSHREVLEYLDNIIDLVRREIVTPSDEVFKQELRKAEQLAED